MMRALADAVWALFAVAAIILLSLFLYAATTPAGATGSMEAPETERRALTGSISGGALEYADEQLSNDIWAVSERLTPIQVEWAALGRKGSVCGVFVEMGRLPVERRRFVLVRSSGYKWLIAADPASVGIFWDKHCRDRHNLWVRQS